MVGLRRRNPAPSPAHRGTAGLVLPGLRHVPAGGGPRGRTESALRRPEGAGLLCPAFIATGGPGRGPGAMDPTALGGGKPPGTGPLGGGRPDGRAPGVVPA
ncbi:MAG: hypothetical protein FJ396_00815 [Verrucomicrobia bacterium]|nr:hypothetical protein [Verrucomicrobiota bacterium]